jgi:hypothetical protein
MILVPHVSTAVIDVECDECCRTFMQVRELREETQMFKRETKPVIESATRSNPVLIARLQVVQSMGSWKSTDVKETRCLLVEINSMTFAVPLL